jgi:hypothetical protein
MLRYNRIYTNGTKAVMNYIFTLGNALQQIVIMFTFLRTTQMAKRYQSVRDFENTPFGRR